MPRKKTQQEYIEEVTKVHNGYYQYDNIIYKDCRTTININCPKHGLIPIHPHCHLKGAGCKECYFEKKSSIVKSKGLFKLINEGSLIHNNKYKYDKSVYVNCETNVIIICPIHGDFQQTPYNHVNKKCECPNCGRIKAISNRPKERTKIWGYSREDVLKCIKDNDITEMHDFRENYRGYYSAARRKLNMMNELNILLSKRTIKHTYDDCKFKASLFKHIKDFREIHPKEYSASINNGWLDEITKHMIPLPSLKDGRCIYLITFDDNTIYIGLTWNYENRIKDHLGLTTNRETTVTKYIKKTGLIPTHTMLYDYMSNDIVCKLENELINEYKSKGYNVLNKQKGGNLGKPKSLEYTLEYCKSVALKYTTRTAGSNSFKKKELSIYAYCQKQEGWLDIVCSHMIPTSEIITVWTEEKIIDFIKQNNITIRSGKGGLKDLSQSAYHSACRLNLLDKLLPKKYLKGTDR
jgi:predicted GIY-YIG superfamily endonuclease